MEATDFVTALPSSPNHLPYSASVSYLTNSALNVTSNFFGTTSAKDIALLPFRLVGKVDHLLFRTVPDFLVKATGLEGVLRGTQDTAAAVGGAVAGGPATGGIAVGSMAHSFAAAQVVSDVMAGDARSATATAVTGAVQGKWSLFFAEGVHNPTFKSYWGMMHYIASRWAITCFLMALILNRVNVYGRSRQRIYLSWSKRLALRLIPIMLFFTQIRQLMQAIRCQTSPEFALYRHGDMDRYSLLDWSTEGGFMHQVTSTALWWSDDQAACAAVGMSSPEPGVKASHGSFSLLWPTFVRLSLSHFVENLSCALQQIPVMTEVGMSVFEHSLAFAEAETMIAHTLTERVTGSNKTSSMSNENDGSTAAKVDLTHSGTIPASGTLLALSDAASSLTGPHALDKVNVPVEVLLVALLSCCNAFSSHIISVMGKQNKLRLLNTGFWGCCFMLAFIWGFWTTSPMVRTGENGDHRPVSGLLHFPTVAIVGFLPHMTILIGIWVCVCIYVLALLLTAVSLGTNPNIRQPSSLTERISIAHDNLQAAIQVKGIAVRWAEDFYTALLRAGFAALTAASEAVFLNEGRSVEMRQFTWLEEERMDEIELSRSVFSDDAHFTIAEEVGLPPSYPGTDDRGSTWESGYSKERKIDDKNKDGDLRSDGTFVYPNPRTDGVGTMQRTTRFYLLFIFMRGIMFTIAGWVAYAFGAFLDRIGITSRPRWLRKLVGKSLKRMEDKQRKARGYGGMKMLDFWLIGGDGKLALPKTDEIDIEPEMRKRVMMDHKEDNVEEALDEKMYDWWKMGGWFGTKDVSGDYLPQAQDGDDHNDITSVITESITSTSDAGDDDAWESEPEGSRTPTQYTPGLSTTMPSQSWSFVDVTRERSPTPDVASDNPLDASTLARYLNPPDRESRLEAHILASHLASGVSGTRIMTRSRYRQELDSERSRILLAGRTPLSTQISPATNSPSSFPPVTSPPSIHSLPTSSDDRPRPLTPSEEAEVLEELILSRRKNHAYSRSKPRPLVQNNSGGGGGFTGDEDDFNRPTGPPCVVCQCEPRTIIAWPCRCLCLCEECRVTLAMNNFGNCVTCRRNVGGFVRLYVP